MTSVVHLDLDDLMRLVRLLGVGPVRDVGILDACVARPRSTAFGVDAYPTVEAKAGALLHSVVRNHGLSDGDKRLGWLATTVFLDVNAAATALGDDAAFDLVMDVAARDLPVDEIAARLLVMRSRPALGG